MNHITRLTQERDDAREAIRAVREELMYLQHYLTSSKFTAPDADYVHVRTDILPKISAIHFMLCGQ